MNTNGLAKLYGHLTPRERLPLLVAAAARGDEAERSRLVNSAPATVFKLPDYHALGEALELLSLFHLAQLLDLATRHWHASGVLGQDGWMSEDQDEETEAREGRLVSSVRLLAYLFTVHADAWRGLCSELKIDADVLVSDLPGYDTVRLTERAARVLAFTADEATAWLRRDGDDTAQVVTVDAAVASLREFLDDRVAWWG